MAGRGRGGFGGGARGGLKGATWEHDPTVTIDSKPSDLFPRHPNIKAPHPSSDRELRQIRHYKNVRNRIHRGPLYTQPSKRNTIGGPIKVFSEDQFNSQFASDSKADMDPFYGVETFSQRMAGKSNTIPKLTGRPFDLKLFPEELWSTLEGRSGEVVKAHIEIVKERQRRRALGLKDPAVEAESEARMKAMMDRIHKLDDDDPVADDEEPGDDAEQDSEFDDDSMGGDYDGEQYFDNGEDDMDGGDEGGGGEEY